MSVCINNPVFSRFPGRRVAFVYTLSSLLATPVWGVLFPSLATILLKELNATPLHITILASIWPISAILAPYWSKRVHEHRRYLVPNLFWGSILQFLPLVFFPFVDNVWFFILSCGWYVAFYRGTIPAWMEMLSISMPNSATRNRVCSVALSLDYACAAVISIFMGALLDYSHHLWRWMFSSAAIAGLMSVFLIKMIKIPQLPAPPCNKQGLVLSLIKPWAKSIEVLKKSPKFLQLQLGFFLGGGAIMVIRPAIPSFFTNVLNLSYSELLVTFACIKGIGFIISSFLWVRGLDKCNIFSLCTVVAAIESLFPILLLLSAQNHFAVFVAYLLYGAMQGGSALSWKLAGPIFAQSGNSAPFTTISLLSVGIRGFIFPFLGSVVFVMYGSYTLVFALSFALCCGSTLIFFMNKFSPLVKKNHL